MIGIPLGKALVSVYGYKCEECYFNDLCHDTRFSNFNMVDCLCKDGKNVIFKLVDYPVEDENV